MAKHEKIFCPRCNVSFECKVGDITHCQCYGISFSEGEKKYIASKYISCLCAGCMQALQSEYNIAQHEIQLQVFFKGR